MFPTTSRSWSRWASSTTPAPGSTVGRFEISLTDRGKEVHRIVSGVYEKHARTIEQIGGIPGDDFARMNASLLRLERYWTDQIKYRL